MAASDSESQDFSLFDPDVAPDLEGSVTHVFRRMRDGQEDAVRDLWERYYPRLLALTRKTLSTWPTRMADADDAVQSAFFGFWQGARRGLFRGEMRRANIWNVLCTIAFRKAMKQARHEKAGKRGRGKVIGESSLAQFSGRKATLEDVAAVVPADAVDVQCTELLELLDDELRQIAVFKLMGFKNREISQQIGCTERRIERKLALIRLRWTQED
jgi:RNA polymerase sigma factor (sigma-70 family)